MCSLLLLPKFLLTMCIKALISSDTSTRRCKVFTDLSRCASAATEISQAVENYESMQTKGGEKGQKVHTNIDALIREATFLQCFLLSRLEVHHRCLKLSHHLENKWYNLVDPARYDSLHVTSQGIRSQERNDIDKQQWLHFCVLQYSIHRFYLQWLILVGLSL